MATVIHQGPSIVFGVLEPKPVRNLPTGKARLRLRSRMPAHLFVKDRYGISKFYLKDCGEFWEPHYEIGPLGRNITIK